MPGRACARRCRPPLACIFCFIVCGQSRGRAGAPHWRLPRPSTRRARRCCPSGVHSCFYLLRSQAGTGARWGTSASLLWRGMGRSLQCAACHHPPPKRDGMSFCPGHFFHGLAALPIRQYCPHPSDHRPDCFIKMVILVSAQSRAGS